jgi:5-methyltetrahydropteroyltriglutamate--homocysteine methyltransferase
MSISCAGSPRTGADWVQIDEPCLVLDLADATRRALHEAYGMFAYALPTLKIMLTTYFGGLEDNLDIALGLPVAGLHLDLVRAPGQLDSVLTKAPQGLSLGVVDGRNVWRANHPAILDRQEPVVAKRGLDQVEIAPSCSLLHVPIDLELETGLDPDLKSWLAFSVQKMGELATLGKALVNGREAMIQQIANSAVAAASRAASPKVHDAAVAARVAAITPDMARRTSPFHVRRQVSMRRLTCRASRRRRSAPSRKPTRCARRARPMRRGLSATLTTTPSCARRPRRPCAGRRRSASTCSYMASSNATTWCSISESSSPAVTSTPGCIATALATSARPSSSRTCRARSQ